MFGMTGCKIMSITLYSETLLLIFFRLVLNLRYALRFLAKKQRRLYLSFYKETIKECLCDYFLLYFLAKVYWKSSCIQAPSCGSSLVSCASFFMARQSQVRLQGTIGNLPNRWLPVTDHLWTDPPSVIGPPVTGKAMTRLAVRGSQDPLMKGLHSVIDHPVIGPLSSPATAPNADKC
jgi:hypothetical protein